MALRTFNTAEIEALTLRVQKTWRALATNGYSDEVQAPSLLPGFGDWRRVSAPVSELGGRIVCVVFRNGVTDEFAVLSLPDSSAECATEADMEVLLSAARKAVVGDYMAVWQTMLNTTPALTNVAVVLAQRLPMMDETVQFLCAFTLIEDTFRDAAEEVRPRLVPIPSVVRAAVDLKFWEATDSSRENVSAWAAQEVEWFLAALSNQQVAVDEESVRIEVEHLIEVYLEEQFDFDPLGVNRMTFRWSMPSVSA